MADNLFLDFDNIDGDATETNHVDWVVIESASWNIERAVDMTNLGSSQRGHANSNFGKVECTSFVGRASNDLMLSVANGTIRPEIVMHWCRSGEAAGEGLVPYCIWTLKNSVVDSYSVSIDADGVPMSTFTIAYISMEVEYKATDQETAGVTTKSNFKWNVATGMVE